MGRIKVLPVNPRYPEDTFWSGTGALKMVGKKTSIPPLGLLTAMSMFPQEHFEVMPLADLNARELRDDEIRSADIVATSAMTVQSESLEEIISRVRALGKRVISGGPHSSTYWEKDIGRDGLTSAVGEGEVVAPEIVKDLIAGRKLRQAYLPEQCSTEGLDVDKFLRPDLKHAPIPRWDLINPKDYYSMAVQFSRGCPRECDFCDIVKLFGKNPRAKTPMQMLGEFDALRKIDWKGQVFIVDDNFIGNKLAVRAFLPKAVSWQQNRKYPFVLYTEASMELGDREHRDILNQMAPAGFDQVFVGIESLDADVIAEMGKRQNRNDFGSVYDLQLRRTREMQRAGLEVTSGFIVGYDNDKPTVFQELFKFIQEAGIPVAMAGLLGAPKGTPLYKRLEAQGRLKEQTRGDNTHGLELNFVPKMDEDFLVKGYVQMIDDLFKSKNYYERCRVLNDNRGEVKAKRALDYSALRAVANVLYQNFVRKPDAQFMKHLAKTAVSNPDAVPEVFAQAVKFYHFRNITSDLVRARGYQQHTDTLYEQAVHKIEGLKQEAGHGVQHARELANRTLHDAEVRLKGLTGSARAKAEPFYQGLKDKLHKYLH